MNESKEWMDSELQRIRIDKYKHLLKRISDKVYEGVTSEDLDCEQKALVWILNEINQFCLDRLPPEPIFVPNKKQDHNKKEDSLDDEAIKDIADFIINRDDQNKIKE
jgi:hypothetical protein